MSALTWVESWAPARGAARVAQAFRAQFAAEPDGVWSAPGRVNIIGEHTDYNGGLCLPIALPHRTYVAVRRRRAGDGLASDVVRLVSAQEPSAGVWSGRLADVGPGAVTGWAAYVVGVPWALRQAGHAVDGFDVVVDSCVPYGAGLSSSAALECAVALALDDLHDLGLGSDEPGRSTLAQLCRLAENEIAGAPTGGLDQSAALLCRAGHALLLDCQDHSTTQVPLDLEAHGLALLVIDTRAEHRLADSQYGARRATCELAAATLGVRTLREVDDLPAALDLLAQLPDADVVQRRVRHVVSEIARVELVTDLLAAGEVARLGPVLTTAHASLRDDYEVSVRELDLAVDTAISTGALGARMVGGGFGGSAIALVRTEDVPGIAASVADAYLTAGFAPPAFLTATAEGSAARH